MRTWRRWLVLRLLSSAAVIGVISTHTAQATSTADKCEATKLGTAGKYHFCRLKAQAKAVKLGGSPDFSKCDAAYGTKWTQAENTGGGMCPSNADEAAMQAFITEETSAIASALTGGTLPEAVLSCKADLTTCNATLASCLAGISVVLKTGQTTSYGAGSDGDLQKGAARSFTDNGDGTITDNTTGLMWEKKSRDGLIHDFGNTYTWSGVSYYFDTDIMDGTITSTFLATLNSGSGFAGHTDWRIPNLNELLTLVEYQNQIPAVDSVFNTNCVPSCTVTTCSCTQPNTYWSSTTHAGPPEYAWSVDFYYGLASFDFKSSNLHVVRAVRGGL